jgi:hypothetical protein
MNNERNDDLLSVVPCRLHEETDKNRHLTSSLPQAVEFYIRLFKFRFGYNTSFCLSKIFK